MRLAGLTENMEYTGLWKVQNRTPARLRSLAPLVLPKPRVDVMRRTSTPSAAFSARRS